jgi:hypothetical protein
MYNIQINELLPRTIIELITSCGIEHNKEKYEN